MSDLDLDERLEIAPGEFKRLGDCTAPEMESALRLIARNRIDAAWIKEQAAGGEPDGRVIARRFFVEATDAERALMAYWQMAKLIEEERRRMDEGA